MELIDFISKHVVEELVCDLDPPIRVYLLDRAEWAAAPLSAVERRAGWAHAETTDELAVLRFCPEVMAGHLADLQLGQRTTAKLPDGRAEAIGPPQFVDSQLRVLELYLMHEILVWRPGQDQATVARAAYLEVCVANSTIAQSLRETFDLFQMTLKEAMTR